MGVAMTADQVALQRTIRAWATSSRAADAVRRCEPGAADTSAEWSRLWSGLADLGVLSIAVPDEVGGTGGSLLDLAAALEETAAAIIPGPVLPSALAGVLISRHGTPDAAKALAPSLADGSLPAAVTLAPAEVTGRRTPGGGLRVSGHAGAVLGATPDAQLVLAATVGADEVWFTLAPQHPGVTVRPVTAVDTSRPLADVDLADVEVPADAVLTGMTSAEVIDLAAVLATAEAAGIAGWTLQTATEYARTRHQFGRPIGGFQAVKHLCAQMLCRAEAVEALAWDAARAADDAPAERAIAAAAAAALALDAAVENAKTCVQVLGGIGFTWEHDAHLYLRRALATRQWLGGSSRWRVRAADLALAGARRRLDLGTALVAGSADAAERDRVRAFAAELLAAPAGERRVRLADSGYLVPHWPPPYGRGASARHQLIIDEELHAAGVERPDLVIGAWAVPTILKHGSDEQRERFVVPTLRGELTWCQLFSEPEAGSDLASLRTRAERVDGGWRLTGQKVWTSLAHQADWGICLARTDPDAPQHRGITYFLVDMRSPGIEIRPLRELTGEVRFNEVFLDGVHVPDAMVVGDVNDGWRLARTTLAEERVAMGGRSALSDGLERLLRLVGPEAGATGATSLDLLGRDRLGGLVTDGTAGSLIGLRATVRRLAAESGGKAAPEQAASAAVLKLVGVAHRQAVAEAALEALGPHGAAVDDATEEIIHEFLVSRCLSIAGGTTQILMTLAAERILGLPRG